MEPAAGLADGTESVTQSSKGEHGLSCAHQQGFCLLKQVTNRENRVEMVSQHLFFFPLARIFERTLVCFNSETVELFGLSYFSIYSICGGIYMQQKLNLSTAQPNVLSNESA